MADQFYLRYYSGHVGAYGHEFIEFEITGNRLRFALNSKSVCTLHSGFGGAWVCADHKHTATEMRA
jgi:hypothetical protein